jgi:hypothetical protein
MASSDLKMRISVVTEEDLRRQVRGLSLEDIISARGGLDVFLEDLLALGESLGLSWKDEVRRMSSEVQFLEDRLKRLGLR